MRNFLQQETMPGAQVTSERVRAAAKRYLSPKQYVLGLLNPK